MTNTTKHTLDIWLIIKSATFTIGACALILWVHIALSIPVVKEAFVLATTVKPETFTELYFEDHINLPKTIQSQKKYSFVFTIHNLENTDMEYPYIVYLQTINKKIILDTNKINLKNGEFKSVKEVFGPLQTIRMEIVVELINKKQSIDFWMEK
jgi:hypothetical protein